MNSQCPKPQRCFLWVCQVAVIPCALVLIWSNRHIRGTSVLPGLFENLLLLKVLTGSLYLIENNDKISMGLFSYFLHNKIHEFGACNGSSLYFVIGDGGYHIFISYHFYQLPVVYFRDNHLVKAE